MKPIFLLLLFLSLDSYNSILTTRNVKPHSKALSQAKSTVAGQNDSQNLEQALDQEKTDSNKLKTSMGNQANGLSEIKQQKKDLELINKSAKKHTLGIAHDQHKLEKTIKQEKIAKQATENAESKAKQYKGKAENDLAAAKQLKAKEKMAKHNLKTSEAKMDQDRSALKTAEANVQTENIEQSKLNQEKAKAKQTLDTTDGNLQKENKKVSKFTNFLDGVKSKGSDILSKNKKLEKLMGHPKVQGLMNSLKSKTGGISSLGSDGKAGKLQDLMSGLKSKIGGTSKLGNTSNDENLGLGSLEGLKKKPKGIGSIMKDMKGFSQISSKKVPELNQAPIISTKSLIQFANPIDAMLSQAESWSMITPEEKQKMEKEIKAAETKVNDAFKKRQALDKKSEETHQKEEKKRLETTTKEKDTIIKNAQAKIDGKEVPPEPPGQAVTLKGSHPELDKAEQEIKKAKETQTANLKKKVEEQKEIQKKLNAVLQKVQANQSKMKLAQMQT